MQSKETKDFFHSLTNSLNLVILTVVILRLLSYYIGMAIHATANPKQSDLSCWKIQDLKNHYRGYSAVAPDGCSLEVGQSVLYTNPNGARLTLTVKGFTTSCEREDNGRTVYVFDDCYWFPVNPDSLSPL